MKNAAAIILYLLYITLSAPLHAQEKLDGLLPVRGFSMYAPPVKDVDRFIKFMDEELASRKVNTLILMVDFNYEYESHPELRNSVALSRADVKKIVAAGRRNNIRIIPQINLLGHQSWENTTHNLLRVYPQFDETPHVKMPQSYEWPNKDGLYCKSYCPLHPGVHKVVYALVDELMQVFEADAFHAGMDEVFYIGDDKCPRCSGRDKARLFADEVIKIKNHLAINGHGLWIWGDRLLDGKTTGIGIWEASYNNTHRAIDMIPKDVVICDWHYERAHPTAVLFASKGFKVISCSWKNPPVAVTQVGDMLRFREHATPEMKKNYYGVMQTVWSGAGEFLEGYYNDKPDEEGGNLTPWASFTNMYDEIQKQERKAK